MKQAISSTDIALIECVNVIRNKWRVRFDVTNNEDGSVSYLEEEFIYKPSLDEIKSLIIDYFNSKVAEEIKTGFVWTEKNVWLSQENQMNYKAAFDLAVQTSGENLPVKFKFGDQSSEYYIFKEVDELKDFYLKMNKHINNALERGWIAKDSIDWKMYC